MKPKITEEQATEMYNDMLDELYTVMGFPGSWALKQLDPIAYNVGFNDYIDTLAEDYDISEFY